MAVFFTSLNSGSNGNCYYIGNETEAILVDAGISCREIEKRMSPLGLRIALVKAIFISHEHTDHIKGLANLSRKHQLPVYITAATLQNSYLQLDSHLVRDFCGTKTIQIGDLVIKAFAKHHDACDPYSFTVSCGNINIGVFTDLGIPCEQLVAHFKNCHAAFLEANYDDAMLDAGNYPYFLKKRIRGGKGHLSNQQALELFTGHRPPFMTHLLLSHLSKNNNCPKLVQQLFEAHANGVQTIIASRDEATALYRIDQDAKQVTVFQSSASQMSFAFE